MPSSSASGVIEPTLISVPAPREANAWLSRVSAVTLSSIIEVSRVGIGVDERRHEADAGVVDEHRDRGVLAQAGLDPRQVPGPREVGLEHLGGGEALAHRVAAARDEHEVVAARGEPVRVRRAETARRAGDECRSVRCHTSSIAR